MPKPQASKKSLPVALGGLALAVVAGYFGFDLGGDGDSASSTSSSEPAAQPSDQSSGEISAKEETCEMDSLPAEAMETTEDILAGGPYDYPDNDNARFGNYEGRLPQQDKNYYREYTVETPGSKNRGARRIITGGGSETDPDVWYYTDDHYESFCSIPDAEE